MSAEHNPNMSLEEQYQAAGWAATYQIMAQFGERTTYAPELTAKVKHTYILALCRLAFKQPYDLVPAIQRDVETKGTEDIREYMGVFTDSNGQHVQSSLELMHGLLYAPDDTTLEAYNLSEFNRLDDAISECSAFYEYAIDDYAAHEGRIGFAVKRIQRDSAFYVGMYDPAVN